VSFSPFDCECDTPSNAAGGIWTAYDGTYGRCPEKAAEMAIQPAFPAGRDVRLLCAAGSVHVAISACSRTGADY
ncbi:MAG TPA: hypothetical protein VM260_11050, partial [Pirellula sp.]|nr:hypothetical protein [Pirellula sp.]